MQQQRGAKPEAGPDADAVDDQARIAALERRVEELEALLEALQDSVHRELSRQGKEIDALTAKTQAPQMARALGRYSREHGL
jgi:uncharacterized coiled-coil protein SlyX